MARTPLAQTSLEAILRCARRSWVRHIARSIGRVRIEGVRGVLALTVVAGVLAVVPVEPPSAFASGGAIVSGFDANVFGGNDDGTYPCTSTGAGTPIGCT